LSRLFRKAKVITGFNTDVEHDGVTYHVQTEDKGLETPLILSLVYTGGAILASKRARYDDLIADGFDEQILAERLQRQHKLICAAIRAGRLEELKKMSGRETSAARASAKKESATGKLRAKSTPSIPPDSVAPPKHEVEKLPAPTSRKATPPIEKAAPPAEKALSSLPKSSQRAVRVASPQPVADFIRAEATTTDALHLSLLDEKHYRGGERVILRVHIERGAERRDAINGAEVIVKILGSTFRPLILQSQTGADGIATFSIQLPHFRSGRAAILVRAAADGYEAELRRIIQQG
jgi:hypothetical protein